MQFYCTFCTARSSATSGKVCLLTVDCKKNKTKQKKSPTDIFNAVLMNQRLLLAPSSSLPVLSTCRDYCNILEKYGPWSQRAVPGGGAGEGYAGSQRRLFLFHYGYGQLDWCQWQWTHIPAAWVTDMTHSDANIGPYTVRESMKEYKALQSVRTCLILYPWAIYLITLLRLGWVVCAAFSCLLFSQQPKLKDGRLERRMRESEGDSKGDWDVLLILRLCTCSIHWMNLIIHTREDICHDLWKQT